MEPLHINEFLCFLTVQLGKIDRENLITILVDKYGYREALEAKDTLISEYKKLQITDEIIDYTIKRIEGKSGALRRVVTDAVDIWTVIDQEKAGKLPIQFVAANQNLLPNVDIEKFNLQFLIASILKLHEKAESQDATLCAIKEQLDCSSNNNNNGNKNKRKLSGSASPFTPKRFQTGQETFVPAPVSVEATSRETAATPDLTEDAGFIIGSDVGNYCGDVGNYCGDAGNNSDDARNYNDYAGNYSNDTGNYSNDAGNYFNDASCYSGD